MIKLNEVSLQLRSAAGTTLVLDKTSIEIPTHTRLSLLGVSGAGKTSVIRLLSGLLEPSTGRVTKTARVSYPVGFAGGFERKHSVYENIRHASTLYDTNFDELAAFVKIAAGFSNDFHSPLEGLTKLERMKFAYAISYGLIFDVYLVDNMIAAGDPEFKEIIECVFWERMKEAGCILATKIPNYARKLGGSVLLLQDKTLTYYPDVEKALREFRA